MPRPRFQRLGAEQQDAILNAALQEFADNGFAEASLNRIIEASGISKGSLYYYFDDKQDLYRHLIHLHMKRMITQAGPFSIPPATDPDSYWSTVEAYCLRLVRVLDASPRLASLLRHWWSVTSGPTIEQLQEEAEQTAIAWLVQALATGQAAGAVRTDVPDALLLAVITAMGRVIDQWVISGPSDPASHQDAVRVTVGMLRRAVEP